MNTTTDNASTSPMTTTQLIPDSYFATINGEDYQTRHARLAREEFEKLKERYWKRKAQADAEIVELTIDFDRIQAYEEYLKEVKRTNELHNTNYHPTPIANFGWEQCVICDEEIRDDPYGHNAAPIEEGVCCKACNQDVIKERQKCWVMGLVDYMNQDHSEEEEK